MSLSTWYNLTVNSLLAGKLIFLDEVSEVLNALFFETHALPCILRLGAKHFGVEGDGRSANHKGNGRLLSARVAS